MSDRYKYQLTVGFRTKRECAETCREIIRQIEQYEGEFSKCWCFKKKNGRWAIWTTGELTETPKEAYKHFIMKKKVDKEEELGVWGARQLLKKLRG